MSGAFEVNFDGLVGPTHNYAGLSPGNLASQKHVNTISHPRAAALQGLAKMKLIHDLGIKQGILPPQNRPDLSALRNLGFNGTDAQIVAAAAKTDSRLLAAVYSSSAMWAANAATVSSSADTADERVHFTTANLLTQFHRSLEVADTADILHRIFPTDAFVNHGPLPSAPLFADEGAANHMRMCDSYGNPGVEMFVYGRSVATDKSPVQFPARQTLEACATIARRHRLRSDRTLFLQQNPHAIDAGAFHNDVVAVSNQNVLLTHGSAFVNQAEAIEQIKRRFTEATGNPPIIIVAQEQELSLADAVGSYVFNSQLLTLPNGRMTMIAPIECEGYADVQRFLQRVLATSPIASIHYQDVHQSMNNGGGPACLRLRVVLNDEQFASVHSGVLFTDPLHARLVEWINRKYRETLHPQDLADPTLIEESRETVAGIRDLMGA